MELKALKKVVANIHTARKKGGAGMKNYEKYKDKIRRYEFNTDGGYFCDEFIKPHILERDNCDGIGCEHCHILQMIWLLEESEEE